ncbi:hypothetical protein H632_c2350p1 [Helicosporidium sp. ATCC 50920]|nr:hypothetical protein H632_c2350p1 [Helicosporidium sp. ATCC 50920]|eukprot:KDD73279.1 hypothetical protein H632_c2350p1 [Helicosporidium sp. ATCC 50920]
MDRPLLPPAFSMGASRPPNVSRVVSGKNNAQDAKTRKLRSRKQYGDMVGGELGRVGSDESALAGVGPSVGAGKRQPSWPWRRPLKAETRFGAVPVSSRPRAGLEASHETLFLNSAPISGRGHTPQTVPPAPLNATRELLKGARLNPLATPAPVDAGSAGAGSVPGLEAASAGFLATGLNFYGSNQGMKSFLCSSASEADRECRRQGVRSSGRSARERERSLSSRGLPRLESLASLAADARDAYVARLEDDNLRLRERLGLLQQELRQARRALALAPEDRADSTSAVSATSGARGEASAAGDGARSGPEAGAEASSMGCGAETRARGAKSTTILF